MKVLGGTIYVGGRLILYGYYAGATTAFPKTNATISCLVDYRNAVDEYLFGDGVFDIRENCNVTYGIREAPWYNLFSHYKRFSFEHPFDGFLVSMYLGFLLAYLFFYAFSKEAQPRPKQWFFYFLVPALIGLMGVLGTNEKEPSLWFSSFFIPSLWFSGVIIIIYVGGFIYLKRQGFIFFLKKLANKDR